MVSNHTSDKQKSNYCEALVDSFEFDEPKSYRQ